ncbi:MAG: formylglycine-generating enzyme family protein [Treponema sp.]|jgi:formylglycine-generating enzyme required for sulfatase activity|nr:formylglycine-generating enzyme family protein [Treponema sp.]
MGAIRAVRVLSGLFLLRLFVVSCSTDSDSGIVFSTPEVYRAMITVIPQGEAETVTGAGGEGVFIAGRTVTIPAYTIAVYETSWELWREVCGWAASHGYKIANMGQPAEAGQGTSPVTAITWRDAIVWCNAYSEMAGLSPVYYAADRVLRESVNNTSSKASDITTAADTADMELGNKGYRLPLEAEWEFAARNDAGLGLFAMSGDIAEWGWDWIHESGITAQTPLTGDGPGNFAHRVIRGGGWTADLDSAYITNRNYFRPFSSSPKIGFRAARSL